MAKNAHQGGSSALPAEMIAERQTGWSQFTRATVITSVAVAGVLILLLLVFRIF
jgi:hypothetical protein